MKSKKSLFQSIFALILSLAILSGMTVAVYAEAEPQTVDSGTCGKNVSWTLYDNGKLVISGTGKMRDYGFYVNSFSPFYYKESLFKEVVIEEGVKSIGNYTFYKCRNFTSISIPDSVISIGVGAFIDCNGLESIKVDEKNTVYDSRENCNAIIKTETNELISGCKNTKIPDNVTSLGNSAFSGCSDLTCINIPASVTSISSSAFDWCSGLENIKVDENNTIYDSRENCNAIIKTETNELISGCKATVVPDGVKSLGDFAFDGCSGLTSINIPAGVTSIGNYAFGWCSGLTSINIPDSVTNIKDYAFIKCSGLTSINISDRVTSIGKSAFRECGGLISINIPDGVTSIETYTFNECSGLTSIKIPDSVTNIGSYAFENCPNLLITNFPESLETIHYTAFKDCTKLNNYTGTISCGIKALCGGITVALNNKFCSISVKGTPIEQLEKLYIPVDIEVVSDNAFAKCTSLKEVTIGNNVKRIGSNAFANCPLETVYFKGTKAEWDEVCGKNVNLSSADVIFVDYSCGEELSAKFSL
ncbi:MAG: leucine-rich repeat domain-containing protein, partial [Oscillospiraceae bacterium]|nr:leucine-rich repeat domain-containing protein [Oscillospiraceae bacterium]